MTFKRALGWFILAVLALGFYGFFYFTGGWESLEMAIYATIGVAVFVGLLLAAFELIYS